MSQDYLPFLPLLLGGFSIAYGFHAVGAGKNTMHSVTLARAERPKLFWLVTGLEFAIGFGLIWLGIQMLGLI